MLSSSQHYISTSISDHLRHISLQDQPLFSPLYSILIDCCVGCTPIPPQYFLGPSFPTFILLPPKNHYFDDGCISWHDTAANLYISSNITIRDHLYDSCLCICRRRAADIEWWWHNHYCFVGCRWRRCRCQLSQMSMAFYGLQGLLNSGSLNRMDIYII